MNHSPTSLIRYFLLFAVTLSLTSRANAFDVIVSARPGGTEAEIAAVTRLPHVSKVSPVFSPDESRMLSSAGRQLLAASKKFRLPSARHFPELQRTVRKRGYRVQLEAAELEFSFELPTALQTTAPKPVIGSSFQTLQWALKNVGQEVAVALDDLTSLFVKGKPGEDLGLDQAPAESANPDRRIKIAIMDSGLDITHPELRDRLNESSAECRAVVQFSKCTKEAEKLKAGEVSVAKEKCNSTYAGKDFDGNGYPLDCVGWNLTAKTSATSQVWGDGDVSDITGHGTHVAALIAARSDDGDGIQGILQNTRIIPVKVMRGGTTEPIRPQNSPSLGGPRDIDLTNLPTPIEKDPNAERGLADLAARGMLYAIRSGANVINMSLGWPAAIDSNLMQQMIDLATSRGILVVAASGNDGTDLLIRPCIFQGVICVGSHDPDGAISHFSNHGPGVDIAAPGLSLLSAFPLNLRSRVFNERVGYELKNGTSASSPLVAGLLARLLNAGYSPTEARARLLLGARPAAPNPRAPPNRQAKVQSGNADLGKAFAVKPQPLIFPSEKRAIAASWDRQSNRIPLKIKFENLWREASEVSIKIQFDGVDGRDVRAYPSTLTATQWKSLEKREFAVYLEVLSDRFESEIQAELIITSTDAATGARKTEKRLVAIETRSTPTASDPELLTRPLRGDSKLISAFGDSDIGSVVSRDGRTERDFIGIKTTDVGLQLILATEEKTQFGVRHTAILPATDGILQARHRVDLDGDGSPDYVLVWQQKPPSGKMTPDFLFRFFDSSLNPKPLEFDGTTASEIIFKNEFSVMDENFQWISLGQRKVPAWINRGTTPELEKAPYDPWNPTPADLPDFRIYVWGPKGVRLVRDDERTPIAFLTASREQMRTGERQVMWISGKGTDAVYELSRLEDMKLSDMRPMDLGGYRQVRVTKMAPLFDASSPGLSNAGDIVGSGFFSKSYRSANRVTAFKYDKGVVFDKVVEPMAKVDGVGAIIGTFTGTKEKSLIAQTIYEMQYEDLNTGDRVSTSLKRFSFMPEFFFAQLFFPVLGDVRNANADRLPMIYVIDGLTGSDSFEILTPRYEGGRLISFARPARLRMAAPKGCQTMGDTVEATQTTASQIVFMCEDRVIFAPLKY